MRIAWGMGEKRETWESVVSSQNGREKSFEQKTAKVTKVRSVWGKGEAVRRRIYPQMTQMGADGDGGT